MFEGFDCTMLRYIGVCGGMGRDEIRGKKGLVEPLTVKTVEVKWVTTHAAFFGKTKLSNQIMLLFLISVSK